MNELNLQNPDFLNRVVFLRYNFEMIEVILKIPNRKQYTDDYKRLITNNKMLDKKQVWQFNSGSLLSTIRENVFLTSFDCLDTV